MRHFYMVPIIICYCCHLICVTSFASPNRIRVLIDSDIGLGQFHDLNESTPADIDDAYAIIHAIRSPKFDVAGITTVFGNTQVKAANQSVQKILKLNHLPQIQWQEGSARAISRKTPCPIGAEGAAKFMASRLEHSPAYLLAIGPLSNISCMLAKYNHVIPNIKGILVVMGQSLNTDFSINGVPVRDLNFESDLRATENLINSKVPMTFFPFELTRKSLVQRRSIERMKANDALLRFLKNSSFAFINHWQKNFKEDGFHPWDSAPVAYLENPNLFKCEMRQMSIDKIQDETKLLAKSTKNTQTPWSFCYDFASNGAIKSFESVVVEKLTRKSGQS